MKKDDLYLDHNMDKITKIIVRGVYMKQFVLGIFVILTFVISPLLTKATPMPCSGGTVLKS